jgi:MerR family redox-sensitive transcriptional activator SoxR
MLARLPELFSLFGRERLHIAGDGLNSLGQYRAAGKNCGQEKRFGLHIQIVDVQADLRSSKLVGMMIGQVAKKCGLAPSAIRFYEDVGVLPKAARVGGRRLYDASIVERLAVLERAKACGFSLAEMRQLFYGFREDTPPSERWQTLARRKIAELDELADKIAATKALLQRPCACKDLAECGRRIIAKERAARETS